MRHALRIQAWLLSWAVILSLSSSLGVPAVGADLEPQLLNQIQAATFEVVAAKPLTDPLTYARPLPTELLPFQERNDQYYSVGSAFSIGNNRFVTAAHVLATGIGSLWGSPALRDANGRVYPIDKIEKFSLARDFIVFTVSGNPNSGVLKINTQPLLHEAVYAVGNALGTGVVVRDGVYTSMTPEDLDGRWKWLRFSAAASPGNSGGPLLDKDGAILGVVLMKSPGENLNYALPIEELVNAPDRQATFDNRVSYQLDVLDAPQIAVFRGQFSLPMSFRDFSTTFLKLADGFSDQQLQALLRKEGDRIFPNGPGAARLLHHLSRMKYFPALMSRHKDGEWELTDSKTTRTSLPANGYVLVGSFGRNLLFRLHRPDDVAGAALSRDPDSFAKDLLMAGFLQRTVGAEKIQVTGLGKPIEDTIHIDDWERRWQARIWPLPFANEMFVTLSLPVPDGYVTIARYSSAADWHDNLVNLEATTDFVAAGYWGTLAQWQEFLGNAALLPATLKSVSVNFTYGHHFDFASRRVNFAFDQDLQDIGPKSLLGLGFTYLGGDDKPRWDIGDIRVQQDDDDYGHWVAIERQVAPSADLDEAYQRYWGKVMHRQHPFDATVHTEDDVTRISAIIDRPTVAAPTFLYSGFVGDAGSHAQEAMKAKLDRLLKKVSVNEPSL
jgi:hypothetical protein